MKFLQLTEAQQKAYLAEPQQCPYCGHRPVNVLGELEPAFDCQITRGCRCPGCGQEWNDVYRFAGAEERDQECVLCEETLNLGDEVETYHYSIFGQPETGLVHASCLKEESHAG